MVEPNPLSFTSYAPGTLRVRERESEREIKRESVCVCGCVGGWRDCHRVSCAHVLYLLCVHTPICIGTTSTLDFTVRNASSSARRFRVDPPADTRFNVFFIGGPTGMI